MDFIMEHLTIPKDYHSGLNLYDTQIAIKTVKDFFQNLLATRLNLSRVSAPLFVDEASGLNDNLNGVERPVNFDIKDQAGKTAEIVHSLAKWKRYALHKYGFGYDEYQGYNESLTLNEIQDALKEAGTDFDLIGMDCCIMSSLEVCYALHNYCNYLQHLI